MYKNVIDSSLTAAAFLRQNLQQMNLQEIKDILDGSGPEMLDAWHTITRDTAIYTVALFAINGPPTCETLAAAGTGTLVSVGNSHYILTAGHIWERSLKRANRVGITLSFGVDHNFPINVDAIEPIGPTKPESWNEWGPDLIFLRVPPVLVGTIKARRVFYPLDFEEPEPAKGQALETQILFGTPQLLGSFTLTHANMETTGCIATVADSQVRNGFDYVDVEIDLPSLGPNANFKGISGGGLWRVLIFIDPQTKKMDSRAALQGVAFYEISNENGRGIVRCHGLATIRACLPQEAAT